MKEGVKEVKEVNYKETIIMDDNVFKQRVMVTNTPLPVSLWFGIRTMTTLWALGSMDTIIAQNNTKRSETLCLIE